jgi:hypothetical protein
MLETLPYPIGALFLWIIARGLKLIDEFASKSLTSRQRTNKRALATPTNKRMMLSQEKGRTPCNSIKSATF